MLIGITGTIGAGKGTLVNYLKETKQFKHYSVSGFLGELVEKEGNPKTRDFLSPMATSLQQEYGGGVVEKMYREKFLKENPGEAIIEAIHRQSEAEFLLSQGGLLLGVDADLEVRYKRTQLRQESEKDDVSFEDFKKQALIEDEGGGDAVRDNNIRAVLGLATHVFINNGSLEDFHEQIETFLAQYED